MKASVLLNILNHVPGESELEWSALDLTLPDGRRVDVEATAETMTPGESRLVFLGTVESSPDPSMI